MKNVPPGRIGALQNGDSIVVTMLTGDRVSGEVIDTTATAITVRTPEGMNRGSEIVTLSLDQIRTIELKTSAGSRNLAGGIVLMGIVFGFALFGIVLPALSS